MCIFEEIRIMAPRKKIVSTDQETVPQISVKTVPVATLEKLQTIAMKEGMTFNEIYIMSFSKLVESYEKVHGKLKPMKKGAGLENI